MLKNKKAEKTHFVCLPFVAFAAAVVIISFWVEIIILTTLQLSLNSFLASQVT